jgi:putative ABC transport system permease protein
MNLLKISWSNVRSKPLSTALSVMLLAFGVVVISLLLLLDKQLSDKFDRNIKDIDFVLGAKGSPMQLILANVYHVDAPTGNIAMEEAARIIKHPMIKEAIPLAYGDSYQKFRIVGTTLKYPDHYNMQMASGRPFQAPFEVTLGATVAAETGLKVGDTFTSVHGYDNEAAEDAHHHEHPFRVVGIYQPADCAIDNLILCMVESVWLMHEHHDHDEEGAVYEAANDSAAAADGHMDEKKASREVTAYLLKKRNPMAAMMLSNIVRSTNMQLADPAIEMNRLTQSFGLGMDVLKAVAVLIMVLAFASIFISLYTSLKERKYELALMRTMGGSRIKLFALIQLEGFLLVLVGSAVGLILSRTGLLVLSHFIEKNFHYRLADIGLLPEEGILLAITVAVGILASLLPAAKALGMDISKTLANA